MPCLLLQGRIDLRTLAGARMITECTSLLLAGIVVLSLAGINISALLLPAGVVLAIASRDLLQNFIAGVLTPGCDCVILYIRQSWTNCAQVLS
jgi:hypothetical protein